MKLRIIQRGDGKYIVQGKKDFFKDWFNFHIWRDDVSNVGDCENDCFTLLEEAKAKLKKEAFNIQVEKNKAKFTVIDEITV